MDKVTQFLYISEAPLSMGFYFLFLFHKNIGGSRHHGTGKSPNTCPTNRVLFDVYALPSFTYPNTSQQSSVPSFLILPFNPPLSSSKITIPFQSSLNLHLKSPLSGSMNNIPFWALFMPSPFLISHPNIQDIIPLNYLVSTQYV